jgi:hypothetical protein
VAQFRRQAAKLAKIKPRRLSFKDVWTTLKDRLLLQPACSVEQWLEQIRTDECFCNIVLD